jgi:Tol biopolymer transport system component
MWRSPATGREGTQPRVRAPGPGAGRLVRRSRLLAALCVVVALLLTACRADGPAGVGSTSVGATSAGCGDPVHYKVFEKDASGSDWSKPNDEIAFDRVGSGGFYHIYTVRPDGSDLQQLGVHSSTFPQRTTGSPAWSPSGQYVAFVAEKPGALPGNFRGDTYGATPGWGGYSDLWVATADGSRAWPLTDMPVGNKDGVLLPQFSPNGDLLEWTQKIEGANGDVDWSIKVAHFNIGAGGKPSLTDTQTIAPAASTYPQEFVETGGFSSNSTELTFTSDYQNHLPFENQIYEIDLATGAITRLTKGGLYNEHPRFTPSGQIIWMDDGGQSHVNRGGTDWWIMNADGSDPHRLTYFNDPSSPDYFGQKVWATAVNTDNWAANQSYFYGDVELSLISSAADIVRVTLTCH